MRHKWILLMVVSWSASRIVEEGDSALPDKPGNAVYGYGAWHPVKSGTIMLRNPIGEAETFALDLGATLELPANAPRRWNLAAPFKGQSVESLTAVAGQSQTISPRPFEVLLFDAHPRS